MSVTIRPLSAADVPLCGRILYDAFLAIATRHNFPRDFPDVESGVALVRMLLAAPGSFGVVAESDDGRIVGSNFVTDDGSVRGIGPISVEPAVQGGGTGRRLMDAVLAHSAGAASIRLVQDAFNAASMSLYASLGFDVREPLVLVAGTPTGTPPSGIAVRPLRSGDLPACQELADRLYGVDRRTEVEAALGSFAPFVATRDGRVTAYTSAAAFWKANHGVAESLDDMAALLLGAARLTGTPISFLLPTRQAELFRWALRGGLRVVKPLSLMTIGAYRDPTGAWFPSVLY